ncbi:MAG: ABC transporter ATP-binding protein [Oscillospiraceae bacterium]|jgi:iron complex transport system ATP-binding protein|nr:ABC transporter ATP-binding protein [Oscillospiraceae bacterium]
MFELEHLTGGYAGENKVIDLSAVFHKQEITVITGPNGCGKSTLLKLMVRLLKPAAGTITLDGADISTYHRKEFAKKVSFLPQARSAPPMSAGALVMHGRYPYLPYTRKYAQTDLEAVENALQMTGTEKFRHLSMERLSGGERQKVYLALLIAQGTDVVLLDEPTTYLDISRQFELMNLIQTLKLQGKTVIAVLHDLGLALRYADRVMVMNHGRLEACGSPDEICRSGTIDKVFQVRTRQIVSAERKEYYFLPKAEG